MPGRRAAGWTLGATGREIVEGLGLTAGADAAMRQGAELLRTRWVEVLKRPGSGRRYPAGLGFITTGGSPRRVIPVEKAAGQSRAAHQASAPGEPPATDTGGLSNAVATERAGFAAFKVGMGGEEGRIGRALEWGVNVAGSKVARHPAENFQIEPRPHGRVAVAESKDDVTGRIWAVLRATGRGG